MFLFTLSIACQNTRAPEFGIAQTETTTVVQNSNTYSVGGLEFVPIPIETFTMGSPEDQNGRQPHPESDQNVESDEPQFQVTLTNPYHLSTTEVTREMFFTYVEDDEMGSANCLEDQCPIQFISWHMAAHFTNMLSNTEGLEQCYSCSGEGRSVECESNFLMVDRYGVQVSDSQAKSNGSLLHVLVQNLPFGLPMVRITKWHRI